MPRRIDSFTEIASGDVQDTDSVLMLRPGEARGMKALVSNLALKVSALISTGVTSVFGRTGSITAQSGDYSAAMIDGLGTAATKNVGTSSGTVAAGDHTHTTLVMNSITLVCPDDLTTHSVTIKKDPDTGEYTLAW